MRRFLTKVSLVLVATTAVAVSLAIATNGTVPGDPSQRWTTNQATPDLPDPDEGADDGHEATSSDDESTAAEPTAQDKPDHLDTAVLGAAIVQETDDQLADTGASTGILLAAGAAMIMVGGGTMGIGRRYARVRA